MCRVLFLLVFDIVLALLSKSSRNRYCSMRAKYWRRSLEWHEDRLSLLFVRRGFETDISRRPENSMKLCIGEVAEEKVRIRVVLNRFFSDLYEKAMKEKVNSVVLGRTVFFAKLKTIDQGSILGNFCKSCSHQWAAPFCLISSKSGEGAIKTMKKEVD